MRYKSFQIKGKGRGKFLGFPTINLEIPALFDLDEGIYACRVWIKHNTFTGAMHFGPIPVFSQKEVTLEIFIIDSPENLIVQAKTEIRFEPLQKLREILNFPTPDDLSKQIALDVAQIKQLLPKQK